MMYPYLLPQVEIIKIRPYSDGDPTHRPKAEWMLVDPPNRYLEVLGKLWMDARGEAKPGKTYYLDKLPYGYALFERPRPNNAKIIDKHLYGHPNHKFFDSPNRFWSHFEHIMKTGTNAGCPCTVCNAQGSIPLPMGTKSTTLRGPGRPKTCDLKLSGPVDEEGSPDPYRHLLNKLKTDGSLDEPIIETSSMDWRCERDLLPSLLNRIAAQHSWMPRVGELVLFVRSLAGEICYDAETKLYKIYKEDSKSFVGCPAWEAGVIGQVADENLGLQDLCLEDTTRRNVTYSGFRVEPFPDPNQAHKTLSKQHTYVPLHQIRPFTFYLEYLSREQNEDWHPTIQHAITVAASVSLLEKYHFTGSWPTATIHCKGIFIGFELICVGDAVRIHAHGDVETTHEILRVNSIKLKLTKLDRSNDCDTDSNHPYNSTIFVSGKAFTLDKSRAHGHPPLRYDYSDETLPRESEGYGEWYWLHDPSKSYQISFNRVLGRCYESAAISVWFPHTADRNEHSRRSSLSIGVKGIQMARMYSSNHDKRIKDGKTWFWGDFRAESLDLETLNGIELSKHDTERNPKKWRKMIKIIDGNAGTEENAEVKRLPLDERGFQGPARRGMATMMSPAMVVESDQRDDLGESRGTGSAESAQKGKKRIHSGDESSGSQEAIDTIELEPVPATLGNYDSGSDTEMDELVDEEQSTSVLDSFRLATTKDRDRRRRVVIEIPARRA